MSLELGAFELLHRIARGGMGEVWKGIHRSTGIPVAFKLMTGPHALADQFGIQFRREVQAMAKLEHPNIVSIYDFGTLPSQAPTLASELQPGSPYLVMEYAPHGDLSDAFDDLDWACTRRILESLLTALAHAHTRGVIHRDIKPGNILLADPEISEVMLTDFGIAHASAEQTRTDATQLTARSVEEAAGTPTYMAPEQFMGKWRDYGPWTDLYSIGVLAYQMTTRRVPFEGKTFVALGMKHMKEDFPALKATYAVPNGFKEWLDRLVAKTPSERYNHAADALADLRRLDTAPFGDRQSNVEFRGWREFEPSQSNVRNAGLGLFGLKRPPFVARHHERDQLWGLVEKTREGNAIQAVVIRGVKGSGTTRLARWLSDLCAEAGLLSTLHTQHNPEAGARSGLSWMLTGYFRCAGLSADDMFERLSTRFEDEPSMGEFEIRALTEIMRTGSQDAATTSAFLRFSSGDQRLDQIHRVLSVESPRRPFLICLDDAHLSIDSLKYALHALEHEFQYRALIVLTVDSEHEFKVPERERLLGAIESHARAQTISIAALPPEDNRLLLHRFGLSSRVANEVVVHAKNRTDFAVQLVQDWIAGGILGVGEQGDLDVDSEALIDLRAAIPKDLSSIWLSRLERISRNFSITRAMSGAQITIPVEASEVERAVVLAACLGTEVDEREWLSACKKEGLAEIPEVLDRMASVGVGQRHERGFSFAGPEIRDVIQARTSAPEWRRANRSCAEAIRPLQETLHPTLGLRIGRHLYESGSQAATLEVLEETYDAVFRTGDLRQIDEVLELMRSALDHCDLSREAIEWGYFYMRLAKRGFWGGDSEVEASGEDLLDRAQSIAENHQDRRLIVKIQLARAWSRAAQGDTEEALELSRHAVRGAPDDVEKAICERILGTQLQNLGRFDEATDHFKRSLALTEDPIDAVSARLGLIACMREDSSHYEEAIEHLRKCIELAQNHGLTYGHALALESWGLIEFERGDFAEAEGHFRRAIEIHRVLGPSSEQALRVRSTLARSLVPQGRFEEAMALLKVMRGRLNDASGPRIHIEDIELACLAGQKRWDAAEALLAPATSFETTPQRIHIRGLGWARAFARLEGHNSLVSALDERMSALKSAWPSLDDVFKLYDEPF